MYTTSQMVIIQLQKRASLYISMRNLVPRRPHFCLSSKVAAAVVCLSCHGVKSHGNGRLITASHRSLFCLSFLCGQIPVIQGTVFPSQGAIGKCVAIEQ